MGEQDRLLRSKFCTPSCIIEEWKSCVGCLVCSPQFVRFSWCLGLTLYLFSDVPVPQQSRILLCSCIFAPTLLPLRVKRYVVCTMKIHKGSSALRCIRRESSMLIVLGRYKRQELKMLSYVTSIATYDACRFHFLHVVYWHNKYCTTPHWKHTEGRHWPWITSALLVIEYTKSSVQHIPVTVHSLMGWR